MRKLDDELRKLDDETERLLENTKKRYEAGIKGEILVGLMLCLLTRRSIPNWLAKAFLEAYFKVFTYQVKSYDDVFGRPLKKGKRLTTERRNMELTPVICEAMRGRKINKDTFDKVGKEFGVSGTVAAELYYSHPKGAREALLRMEAFFRR